MVAAVTIVLLLAVAIIGCYHYWLLPAVEIAFNCGVILTIGGSGVLVPHGLRKYLRSTKMITC